MRTFERTHPWITFQVDLNEFDPGLWIQLGGACSKCEHLAGVPLRPDTAMLLHRLFLAKGVRGTTAIEGNTLTEEEILKQIDGKLRLPPSKEYLAREAMNILKACQTIWEEARGADPPSITPEMVRGFNRSVLDGLPLEDGVIPGEI